MKATLLREYYQGTPAGELRIDREQGILHGVKILGLASRNRRDYPAKTLAGALPLYERAKVNLDHPAGRPLEARRYRDRFGVIRNVALREEEGLFADFHFNPRHPLAEQLLWDAEHAPENVGFSHHVEAVVENRDGKQVVREILAVRSVDLVADPATTRGLFESLDPETFDPAALAQAGKLRELIERCESVLERFAPPVTEQRPIAREQLLPNRENDLAAFLKAIRIK